MQGNAGLNSNSKEIEHFPLCDLWTYSGHIIFMAIYTENIDPDSTWYSFYQHYSL